MKVILTTSESILCGKVRLLSYTFNDILPVETLANFVSKVKGKCDNSNENHAFQM